MEVMGNILQSAILPRNTEWEEGQENKTKFQKKKKQQANPKRTRERDKIKLNPLFGTT